MKQILTASTLSLMLIASGGWMSSQMVSAVTFSPPPNSGTPSKATGGASRGSLFAPKSGESAPKRSTGGASRGSLFAPKSSESAPKRSTGGASRGSLFAPKSGESTPKRTSGGASRGDLFAPKSSQPAPQKTDGGASREGRRYLNFPESNVEQPAAILALLPQTYFGTTVSQRAEILVYLPDSEAREGVFSLKDAQGNTLHQMTVPVSGQGGVISIKVPTDLQLEKNYQWFLALKIDGELSPRTPYVDGWIKRIQPSAEITMAMQQKDLLKLATALGKNGVWYDCVATLAKLRANQPKDANLDKQWSELLESVGLQQIEKAPLVALN
ncbi:DUF928 domain-containing protein [Rivularia sp. UHCC 0363]|uniref:DUF928 domain-containing protein n=1 Tax=Rivularia sp. UHCC 0363 TaxID=3110244 RepID=UPI002B1FAB63|nr:DUF928 domain-containing protein [Rivularia sp. UHCC 0363]MEA5596591.1 DUF928 domain-containing protein [Rivularia sp. UHCC 0363]